MSQTGYTPILIYASGTTGNTPAAANLTSSSSGAELALNYYDGKLFYKDNTGTVQVLATKGAAQNSISFGTTGLTPSTATQGAVTVAGTLVIANGGTGLTSFTANQIHYGSFSQSSGLTFDGTTFTASNISTSGSVTLSGGTANGVAYLNGSKVLTTGSSLTFSSGTLTIGTAVVSPTIGAASGSALSLQSNGTTNATLDTNGNLGLGVTPKSAGQNLELINGAVVLAQGTQGTFAVNAYYNGGWKYAANGAASMFQQNAGQHQWYNASSGTAGNAISWTQAMTLDANSNLYLTGTYYDNSNTAYYVKPSSTSKMDAMIGYGTSTFDSVSSLPWQIWTGLSINANAAGPTTVMSFFSNGAPSTRCGWIGVSGSSTSFNTSSDYRLKSNPQELTNSGAVIDALIPRTWTWNDGSAGIGFLAHEAQNAGWTHSVYGEKDAMIDIGDIKTKNGKVVMSGVRQPPRLEEGQTWTKTGQGPDYQGMEYGSSEMIAYIIAELKDLRKRLKAANIN
jgi:hypothetical protein